MATKRRKNRHRKSKLTKIKRLQLSDLPDDVLICIISLLPTRESVATSILSKRWLNLWTSITKLEFCDFSYGRKQRGRFINFVDRVIMILRNRTDLESFSLSCDHSPRINNWITSVVECNIKELSLELTNVIGSTRILPFMLFSCESLVKLELKMSFNILVFPCSISLPNLKYLKLGCIKFDNDESAKKLLSHPLLEELDIRWCNWISVESLIVNVPKLRVLNLQENIWGDHGLPGSDALVDRKVGFSGNNLEYFRFKGLLVSGFYICGSAMKLKEAEILNTFVNPSLENVDILVKPCYNLLSGLSWVRNLTLTEGFLQILERTPQLVHKIPVFECVTQLNLEAYGWGIKIRIDSLMVTKIYERCPHLEHLNISKMMSNTMKGLLLHPIPPCFRTHLKKITIVNYQCEFEEENALEVLLNSAQVLKEIVLVYTMHCLCNEYKVQKLKAKLNELFKASKNCTLSIVYI